MNPMIAMKSAFHSLFIILIVCISCEQPEKHYVLKLKGSESMHETFQVLIDDFQRVQDTITVTLEGGGSRTGLVAIFNGEVNIGLSSFPFDLEFLYGKNHEIREKVVAYDGIVLINHKSNPLQQLTYDQISGIYNGKYTDWSQLGGKKGPILPVVRDGNSGTQQFFTEYYEIESLSSRSVVARENSEIVTHVRTNENGIGFIGLAYFTESVNNILLESPVQNAFVTPSIRTLTQGVYPLKRSLRIYFRENDPATEAFLRYLETPRAKALIENFGLISIDDKTPQLVSR